MAEKEYVRNEKKADAERSSEDIRRNIAKEKENISRKVDQIGERIKERLDWREYVKDSPFWAIGIAVGLGYLASRVFITRTTPMERIVKTLAEGAHDSLDGLNARVSGPGLIKMTLLTLATKAAADWIQNTRPAAKAEGGDSGPQPSNRGDATINREMEP